MNCDFDGIASAIVLIAVMLALGFAPDIERYYNETVLIAEK